MVCSCQALYTTYHPVLMFSMQTFSKRHEMKRSHKQHRADDLIWQSSGSVCHGHCTSKVTGADGRKAPRQKESCCTFGSNVAWKSLVHHTSSV